MLRKLTLPKALFLLVGFVAFLMVCAHAPGRAWAQDNAPEGQQDDAKQDEQKKQSDKYLGIEWDDQKDKKQQEDPDAAQPAQKVDLEATLLPIQLKKLELIQKNVAKVDEFAQKIQDIYDGKDKTLGKKDAVPRFYNAGKQYLKEHNSVQALGKQVKDRDAKLTLLREYGDVYRNKACDMYCKAAKTVIELATTLPMLKQAGIYINAARRVDPDYPGTEEVVNLGRAKAEQMVAQLNQATTGVPGGGKDEAPGEKHYDDQRTDNKTDPKDTGRDDYKNTGR